MTTTNPAKPETEALKKGTMGYVHSIETAGIVDGPGVRYVVFLSGCSLSCQYCHNPDTLKLKQGKLKTAAEVLDDIREYLEFIRRASGGVTISGGEPLTQAQFTRAILKGCKEMGLHTALDTNGYLGESADDELLSYTDLVLLDIKSGLPELHKTVTGVSMEPTLEFAFRLAETGKPMWVRFVLVPGLTDSEENITAVADIAARLGNVERVDILPFHQMGAYKWDELGMEYKLKDTRTANDEDVARARKIFAAKGLNTV